VTEGVLRLLTPGLYTLVVDQGRPATRSLGVPLGGAADQCSLALGNALVGNPSEMAALEIALAGPILEANVPLACVLYGAPFDLATDSRPLRPNNTFTLHPGEQLRIGGAARGMRAYLCIRGGVQTPLVLGSRSSLQPLSAGSELPCRADTIPGRFVRDIMEVECQEDVTTLRVLEGPQASWFAGASFFDGPHFAVSPASNRMGLRLRGRPLTVPDRELVSEPVCPGSVQVTRDGQCILLGVDGQTIGGYPRIAQVIRADLDRLGQLRPGQQLRFQRVGLAEAEDLYRHQQAELRRWLLRLRMMAG
jgi:biotin-dependent carboxylase-like uncharacterized protein